MHTKQLKYFLEIAEQGNMKRAADTMSVAQSALSRQLGLLEDDLGVRLFHRNGRGVVLTEAGRHLLQHARRILHDVENTRTELAAFSDRPRGTVTLGVTPTITQTLAVPLIQNLRRDHPLISLKIIEGFSGHVLEWLSSGRVEVGVVYNAPDTGKFQTMDLVSEDLFLVCPTDSRSGASGETDLNSIADLPLILPSPPHGLRILIETVAAMNGIGLRVDLELDALQPIKTLVECGMGWTILPFPAVQAEVATGRLRVQRIVNPVICRRVMLATMINRPVSSSIQTVLSVIRDVTHRLVAGGAWIEPDP